MVKLTEDMVVARSKGSELHNIKKLNCWGSELTNVSVVRKLPNVEVLSLSVNQISTLEDFQYCGNLQELYIRKNNIADINEVLYLRQIPKLKSLWLADNPCAEFEQYRLTVLRALPHLQKLDNVPVEPEEVQQAMVCGLHLPLPDSNFSVQDAAEVPRSNSNGELLRSESGCGSGSLSDSSPSAVPTHPPALSGQTNGYNQSLEEGYEYTQNLYDEDEEQPPMRRTSYASPPEIETYERRPPSQGYSSQNGHFPDKGDKPPQHPVRGNNPKQLPSQNRNSRYYEPPVPTYADYEDDGRSSVSSSQQYGPTTQRRTSYGSNIPQPQRQSPPRRPSQAATPIDPETPMDTRSFSRSSSDLRASREQYREQSWASDADGYNRDRGYARPDDGYRQKEGYAGRPSQDFRSPSNEMRHFASRPSSVGDVLQQHYDTTYRRVDQQIATANRAAAASIERPSPTRPYPLRPKTRNANVLSAVLCLIKELDYSSLEVVEMAIRCRMEELDD